jgi:hypothetical protein
MHHTDFDYEENPKNYFTNTPANLHFKEDVIGLELEHDMAFTDAVFQIENGDTLVIGYLTPDQDQSTYDFSDGESLEVFRSQEARDAHYMEMQEQNRHPMIVECYDHGAKHYSVMGTKDYPDRQWDVAPNSVYTPSNYDLNEFNAGNIDAKELVARANSTLETYSDWANGNVYGAVTEKHKYDPDSEQWVNQNDSDTCWGYIGSALAEAALKSDHMNFDAIPEPEPVAQRPKRAAGSGYSM